MSLRQCASGSVALHVCDSYCIDLIQYFFGDLHHLATIFHAIKCDELHTQHAPEKSIASVQQKNTQSSELGHLQKVKYWPFRQFYQRRLIPPIGNCVRIFHRPPIDFVLEILALFIDDTCSRVEELIRPVRLTSTKFMVCITNNKNVPNRTLQFFVDSHNTRMWAFERPLVYGTESRGKKLYLEIFVCKFRLILFFTIFFFCLLWFMSVSTFNSLLARSLTDDYGERWREKQNAKIFIIKWKLPNGGISRKSFHLKIDLWTRHRFQCGSHTQRHRMAGSGNEHFCFVYF